MDNKPIIPQQGDIALIGNKFCPVGLLIQKFLHCKYNHVAWLCSDTAVLELKAKGLVYTPLNKYSDSKFYRIKIIRLKLSPTDIWLAEECLKIFNEPQSYLKFLLTILHFLFKQTKKLPRQTCSGIVATALNCVGYKISNKSSNLVTPKDFDIIKDCEVVYET